jgi:phosphate transport system substrate-binding protein
MVAVASAEHAGVNAKTSVAPGLITYEPIKELSGRLTIAGSDTMLPLMTRLAADFMALYPDTTIAVEGGGSAAGIREFIVGYSSQRRGEKARDGHDGAAQTTVLASSREMTSKELSSFSSRFGYEPMVLPIAMDPVAIYVHPNNPIRGLTVKQIDGIFSSTQKRGIAPIIDWEQLGWNSGSIHVYGRDRSSGTHDFFESVALDGGKLREDINMKPGSASEILAIARDPLAIGFAGIGFQTSTVRVCL